MDKKIIVLTLYGTGKVINDFTITLFDNKSYGFGKSSAQEYCNNINDIELKDDNWIYATIVKKNKKIKFEKPGSYTDFDLLSTLDDISIQKVLRDVNAPIFNSVFEWDLKFDSFSLVIIINSPKIFECFLLILFYKYFL